MGNGMIDLWDLATSVNSPLKNLAREVIKTASQVEIHTVCEYEHCPFFYCGSARRASIKRNTSSVVGFIILL